MTKPMYTFIEQLDVRLINYQGDDEQICDAARVSFDNDALD